MAALLESGQLFAKRYRVERFLAEGGYGAVYIAEQLATDARVAIKVLWPNLLGSSAVAQFQQEARIAGRVQSEHIVRVIDAGFDEESGMPFLAMELLSGCTLEEAVEKHGPMPSDRVVTYLSQVASALDKAHGYVERDGSPCPIVHRDLKPDNLFLGQRDDGSPLVKILDFGIAKVLSSSGNMSQEVKGTPLYMAYEQAAGGAVTPRTDVWALGLIAFYLLTGTSYWRTTRSAEGSLTQLFAEVLQLPLDPPSVRVAEISAGAVLPPGFDEWFLGCVQRDPRQRFESAGSAIAALAAIAPRGIGDAAPRPPLPVVSTGTSTAQAISMSATIPGASPKRGRAGLVAALVLVALVGVVAVGAGVWRQTRTPTAEPGQSSLATEPVPPSLPGETSPPTSSAPMADAGPVAVLPSTRPRPPSVATATTKPVAAAPTASASRTPTSPSKAKPGDQDVVFTER